MYIRRMNKIFLSRHARASSYGIFLLPLSLLLPPFLRPGWVFYMASLSRAFLSWLVCAQFLQLPPKSLLYPFVFCDSTAPTQIENSTHHRKASCSKNGWVYRGSQWIFLHSKYINSQDAHGKIVNVISHCENSNRNYKEIPLCTHWDGYNQKDRQPLVRIEKLGHS